MADAPNTKATHVIIGCKLPHGLVLEHPKTGARITIRGKNQIQLKGVDYCTTRVDADFWAAWKSAHGKFPALVNGAIFEAKTVADAKAIAKDLKGEKTGFEPMAREKDPRAAGVKAVAEKQEESDEEFEDA